MVLPHCFWKDLWLQGINSENFPRAFSFVTKEDASVQEFLNASRLYENFFLPMSPKAMAELRVLQTKTANIQLTVNTHDTWTYAWGSHNYSSRLLLILLQEFTTSHHIQMDLEVQMYPQIEVICLVGSIRLNTRNMLRRRHYQINSLFDYLLCDQHLEETIEHMLFHCEFSTAC
jgi:hypothetical protein